MISTLGSCLHTSIGSQEQVNLSLYSTPLEYKLTDSWVCNEYPKHIPVCFHGEILHISISIRLWCGPDTRQLTNSSQFQKHCRILWSATVHKNIKLVTCVTKSGHLTFNKKIAIRRHGKSPDQTAISKFMYFNRYHANIETEQSQKMHR